MLLLESAAEWQGYVMVRGAQLLGVALLVAGCSTASTATYAPGQLPIEATEGRIVASRAVEIAGNNSMIGLSAGATIGFSVVGLTGLAAAVGSGGVQGLVALLGGLGGAGIGYLAEERIRSREGIEYIVEMADGRTVTVVQSHEGPEPPLPEGAPVLVVQVGALFSQVVERGHGERSGAGGAAGWVNPDTPLPGATSPPPEAEEVAVARGTAPTAEAPVEVRPAEGDKIDQLPNLGAPQPSPARPTPPAVESAEPTLIEPQATAAEQEPAIEPVPVNQTSHAAEEGPHPSDDNSARPISNIAKFMRELHGRTTSKSTERHP